MRDRQEFFTNENNISKIKIEIQNTQTAMALFGEHNANLTYLEQQLDINISDRGTVLTISGTQANSAEEIIKNLLDKLNNNKDYISKADIDAELRFLGKEEKTMNDTPNKTYRQSIKVNRKSIEARSPTQASSIDALGDKALVFGIGPAGTGTPYIAVARAVEMYETKMGERMVFCRPAVGAVDNL